MEIIRGTTPTLIFKFSEIAPSDISACYLLIKQCGHTVVQKELTDSEITSRGLEFTLTQADTLALSGREKAQVVLDWKTTGGVRGRSNMYDCTIKPAGKDNVY